MNDDIKSQILENLFEGVYYVNRERRVTYWNKAAEKITGYTAREVLNRKCADAILCHVSSDGNDMCRNGCPLHNTLQSGSEHETLAYLKHKRGHRVPVNIRVTAVYDENGNITGAVEMFRKAQGDIEREQRLRILEELAYIDPLTELPNRRYLESKIESRLNELRRYQWPFGVVFIDVDNFKRVNDTYGHDMGDKVLRMVARTLKANNRGSDVFGRYGGEEFVGVIANSDRQTLLHTAERLRMVIEASYLDKENPLAVTVSIGVSSAGPQDTIETLLKRADAQMYRSKKTGRNRVMG